MTNLGTLGGPNSTAYGINNSGQVVGSAYTNGVTYNAFRYSSGTMTNLGTLGGSLSAANGINNSGQVVGEADTSAGNYDAFLYSSGTGMEDLNTLYASLLVSGTGPQTGFTTLSDANAINNLGEIVGYGTYWNGSSDEIQAFALTPNGDVPEPSTWALLLGGLGLLFFWRTRMRRDSV
jgi:probable HAF family extracellular repeat protein